MAVPRCRRQRPDRVLVLCRRRPADGGARRRPRRVVLRAGIATAGVGRGVAAQRPRRPRRRGRPRARRLPRHRVGGAARSHGVPAGAPPTTGPPGARRSGRSAPAAGAPAALGASCSRSVPPTFGSPPDEAAAYFNEAMGLQLTADDVDALEARTEGWIAALQLAALSMQGRDDTSRFIASFAGDDRFVVDYLAEEVLERQPETVRRFLLDTAILDRFTGALCDAVTGGSGGKAMLEQLDRANLFLVPLDDRRLWYRYHHLFADVLRARLLDEEPDRVDELHRRASAWYEAAGDPPEAIAHAMAGHDVERAAQLIELAAPVLFQTRQEATARRWLTALPDELFAARPVLSIELVGALMVSGEIAGVEPLLESIDRWLDPAVDATDADRVRPRRVRPPPGAGGGLPRRAGAHRRGHPGHDRARRPCTRPRRPVGPPPPGQCRRACWGSRTGRSGTSNPPAAATPRRWPASPRRATSATCWAAPSRSPTSRSPRDA